MRHPAYTVTYSVVQTSSSLLTITLYTIRSEKKTLVYNDTKYPVPYITLKTSSTIFESY